MSKNELYFAKTFGMQFVPSPKPTVSPLKMDGWNFWNTIVSFGMAYFQGRTVSFGEVTFFFPRLKSSQKSKMELNCVRRKSR